MRRPLPSRTALIALAALVLVAMAALLQNKPPDTCDKVKPGPPMSQPKQRH